MESMKDLPFGLALSGGMLANGLASNLRSGSTQWAMAWLSAAVSAATFVALRCAANKPVLAWLARRVMVVAALAAAVSWRCPSWYTVLALVPMALTGGACIIAGRPHLPVWLSKAASVWAVLYLLTSLTCLFAMGAADWAEAVAMVTPIVVAVALILPDKYYHELAQAVLPGPEFDHLLNHGFLADDLLPNGWNNPAISALVDSGVAFLAIALLQFQPTAVVLQLVAGVLPAWLASEPTTAGPAAAAWA